MFYPFYDGPELKTGNPSPYYNTAKQNNDVTTQWVSMCSICRIQYGSIS